MKLELLRLSHIKRVLGATAVFAVVACSSSDNPFNSKDKKETPQERMESLLTHPHQIQFSDVKELVLDQRCNQCHGAKNPAAGLSLEKLENLYAFDEELLRPGFPEDSHLYNIVTKPGGSLMMPPKPAEPLSDDEKKLIYSWIANGAKGEKEAMALAGQPLSEQLAPYFENPETIDLGVVNRYVFEPGRCYSCHSDKGESPDKKAILFGADFNSYYRLFLLGGIVPGRPSDRITDGGTRQVIMEKGSRIYQAVAVDQSMPPEGYRPLNALRVKLLRLWILNCAIEDYSKMQKDFLLENPSNERVRRCFE